eukprot:647015-Ditylum_brightwellii.AAC.1
MSSVTASIRRLKAINEKCGGTQKEVGEKFVFQGDTSGMTRYGVQQAKTAERIRFVRQVMAELEAAEQGNASRQRQ